MAFYSSGVEYGIHSLVCMVDTKGDDREMNVRELAELQAFAKQEHGIDELAACPVRGLRIGGGYEDMCAIAAVQMM